MACLLLILKSHYLLKKIFKKYIFNIYFEILVAQLIPKNMTILY